MSRRVIVPVDLGGSNCQCVLRPPKRKYPDMALVKALIENYRINRGHVDEVAFYHGGIPSDELLAAVAPYPSRVAIHPYELTREEARRLAKASVKVIELEFLTFDASIIHNLKRGYHPNVAPSMVKGLKELGFSIGVTLSPGLPGGSVEQCTEDAHYCAQLGVDFVRICPQLVFAQTQLYKWWESKKYVPPTLQDVVYVVHQMLDIFDHYEVEVIRIGWQPKQDFSARIMAGPQHPNLRALVEYRRFYQRMEQILTELDAEVVEILVNPKDISWVKGEAGENVHRLRVHFRLKDLRIRPEQSVPRGELRWKQIK